MSRYKIETSDRIEHLYALHGSDFFWSLWDMNDWFRSQIAHNINLKGDQLDILDKAREELHEIMKNHRISLEMFE